MKFDGKMVTVAEAVVGDETGAAKMVIRNGKPFPLMDDRGRRAGEGGVYHYSFERTSENIE